MKTAPWLMWGGSQSFNMQCTSPGMLLQESAQLSQVRYGRPTTWRFFFAATVLGGHTTNPAPVIVLFNLSMGLGRSTVTIPAFERYRFDVGIGNVANQAKFSTSVNGPARDDSLPVPPDPTSGPFLENAVGLLPAENIQIQAQVLYQASVVGDNIQIEVHSYVAPEVHVRPEWHEGEFPGDENKGH